ncbi:isoprenoid synthase domain-containing protein [Auriculariales sp. MPI-PUGE-AT-0066]|nr:isoprenoid synthase domain-containing protein [Auriculariales sp. MPI-PUGE-AT-0066]
MSFFASSRRHATREIRTHSTHSGTPSVSNSLRHCAEMVRERDYASYLASGNFTAPFRDAFLALRAFSIEMASVPEMVSNPTLGKMRFQWWRDMLKQIYEDDPPHQPIAEAVHYAARVAGRVPAYHLKRIIDARHSDLTKTSYSSVSDLTDLAEATSSTLLYAQLALVPLPPQAQDNHSHIASHIGTAWGLSTLLRALPYHAAQRRLVLPVDLTVAHGVSHEDVFRYGRDAKGVSDAVYALATEANDHVLAARQLLEDGGMVEQAAPIILAASVPTMMYLERLEKADFDAFAPELQTKDWKLAWRMWRAVRSRQI